MPTIDHFFEDTYDLLDAYTRALNPIPSDGVLKVAGPVEELQGEFRSRLRQLSALYQRIELLTEYTYVALLPKGDYRRQQWKGGIPAPFSVWQPHSEELIMWVDCFYFVAWRALEVINQTSPKVFPHVGRIDVPGIRNVRNMLLQHPEASATIQAWSLDPDNGLRIKPADMRPGSTVFDDPGLFVNAAAFRDKVDRALRRAIGALTRTG